MNQSLGSDNHSGVHPEILQSIVDINKNHHPSYGTDDITQQAQKKFNELFGPCQTHFVFNGTAANVLSLKALLKPHHSVICAEDSHLNIDECGAPEAIGGFKLIPLPTKNGKISIEDIKDQLIRGGDQHFSQPKMVSITQPTEMGTLYTYEEMKSLSEFCKENRLFFHIDGARFINAAFKLGKSFKELTYDLGVDILSFGGTKNGLLMGEAVVIFNKQAQEDFKYIRKQTMQLPSKMRFISNQFLRLFSNHLWKEIAGHTTGLAQYLEQSLADIPEIEIAATVDSNAVFARTPKAWIKPLKETCYFYVWDESDWTVRWMMSFDSTKEEIDRFVKKIKELRDL